jgi:hypothetical protein
MRNVTAPMHAISSYALSNILFLARFKAALYVDASFKLLGKERKWRLLDLADVWDLGSSYKSWYQPGLEARYQHQCSPDDPGAGVTNRFPISPTEAPASLQAGGVTPRAACGLLSSGVCRYPESPSAAWDALPPAVRDPDEWTAPNAGDLATFLAWCKEDMPAHVEDPAANTPDDLVSGVTDTVQWGYDVGLEAWAQQQLCVDGQVWNAWLGDLEATFESADCRYADPRTGAVHTFPCGEMNDEMLAIWGCLDVDASVFAERLALAFPHLVFNHPAHGPIFDLDQMFDPVTVPVQHPDGSVTMEAELQYTLAALRPYIRDYDSAAPFYVFDAGRRWLERVDACFEARFEDPAETRCECAADADCDLDAGDRCVDGACRARRVVGEDCDGGDCAPRYEYFRKECPPVEMVVRAGPCCGDGVVEASDDPRYVEGCDDGNTVDGDGCSSTCQVEAGGPPRACRADGDRCLDRCPRGQRCDESCSVCVEPAEPAPRCRRDRERGVCLNECPQGFACDYECRACVADGPALPCQTRDGRCLDACPDGRRCDDACRACVPEPAAPSCRREDGACVDACPDGQVCDAACGACVPEAAAPPCRREDGTCVDECPEGLVCDAGCGRCVEASCGFRDGVCVNGCPDGQVCDARCAACVDGGETYPCQQREGVCFGKCPADQVCDDGCRRCVDPAPAACRRDDATGLCLDECPEGQACDGECGACAAIVSCVDACHRGALDALAACVADGGEPQRCAEAALANYAVCMRPCGDSACERDCHRRGQATWIHCHDERREPALCDALAEDAIRACRQGCRQ